MNYKLEPFPGKLEKQLVKCKRSAAWKIVLTDEQRAWLIRWFPEEENPRLLKLSGMSHSTLHRYGIMIRCAVSQSARPPVWAPSACGRRCAMESAIIPSRYSKSRTPNDTAHS